jgi:hypothetical protein
VWTTFFPIILAISSNHLHHPTHKTHPDGHEPNQSQHCPFDSYRPNYEKKPQSLAARNVEIGNIKDELAEFQMTGGTTANTIGLAPKIISDTGASSHLTGDRLALFDFHSLKRPIPLRVATDGCSELITWMGTLIFPWKNGTTVFVKGVMYCEQAHSTLILPAALRQAKLIITYDLGKDTFHFLSLDGTILFESPKDKVRRCWTLFQLIQPSSLSLSATSPISFPAIFAPTPAAVRSLDKKSDFLFQFPIDKHASDLTKNEIQLLFWPCKPEAYA